MSKSKQKSRNDFDEMEYDENTCGPRSNYLEKRHLKRMERAIKTKDADALYDTSINDLGPDPEEDFDPSRDDWEEWKSNNA